MKHLAFISLLWLLATPVWACRCPDRNLSAYFEAATEVGIGRLVASEEMTGRNAAKRRMLTFELLLPLHKSKRAPPLHANDVVRYTTAVSSAACGVIPQAGDIVVFFGYPTDGSLLAIDSCSGTRTVRSADSDVIVAGFKDVLGEQVMTQLDALAAPDDLREVQHDRPAIGPDDSRDLQAPPPCAACP